MTQTTLRLIAAVLGQASREFADTIRDFKAQLPHRLVLPELKNPIDVPRVMELTGLSRRSVVANWTRDIHSSFAVKPGRGRKHALSDADAALVMSETRKRRRGSRTVAKLLTASTGTEVSHMTILRLWHSEGLKPFRVRREAFSTADVELARVAFAQHVWNWACRCWRCLVPGDEFYLHTVHRPNGQNDVVWARNRSDVEDLLRSPQLAYHACVGLFVCFTSRRMAWHVKDDGESWTGELFRKSIITDVIKPLLEEKENVEAHVTSSCVLHDNASGWRATETQKLLEDQRFDFFPSHGYGRYPPYSPFLNPAEMLGAFLQGQVDSLLAAGPCADKLKKAAIKAALLTALRANERNSELFVRLLRTFPLSLRMVRASNGKPIRYHG